MPWAIISRRRALEPHPSQLYQFALEGWCFHHPEPVLCRHLPAAPSPACSCCSTACSASWWSSSVNRDSQLGLYFNEISMGQILSTPMIVAGALMVWAAYKAARLFGNAPGGQVMRAYLDLMQRSGRGGPSNRIAPGPELSPCSAIRCASIC